MTLPAGARVGGYEIGALNGSGGMGEVYRARDTRLNRDVAIKVLLPAVAGDNERLARFNREAQVLASLNHPNIAHIHGVEQGPDGPLLVLEFVDGPTLADRVAQGPIPPDEAIAIARQIADALESAHERGVIHRDLKPANIKVDGHGTVKVLDFGLAKAIDSGNGNQPGIDLQNSPTITSPAMTQAGFILGTAAYMSPEQAKGRVVDKRSDVWAFGCVLYEMLTGTRAFGGEDVTETIAAVVRAEPDWTKLPDDASPQLRLLLKRCLEKDRRARVADLSVARFLMTETVDSEPATGGTAVSRRVAAVAAGALAVGMAIGAGAWAWALSSRRPASVPPIVRFEIAPPVDQRLLQGGTSGVLVAPDGSFVIYRASRSEAGIQSSVLMVRTLADVAPRVLPETTNARNPFISPDGRWVGFFGPNQLRKVAISGGPASAICAYSGAPLGASWGDDDVIVFSATQMGGLQRVSANGGDPKPLTSSETRRDIHLSPHVLPGSKFVLFAAAGGVTSASRIESVEVATGAQKTVLQGAHHATFVSSGTPHLHG